MTRKITHSLKPAVVLLLAVALTACDSDSPTAPSVTPTAAAPGTGASASWTLTVTSDPSSISLDELLELGGVTARITVTARRSDNNQVPPTGATAILSATDGTLTSGSSSGTEIPVAFDSGGRATAQLMLPAKVVSIVVRAQLEQNASQITVRVLEATEEPPLFIESIIPSSGPPSGGTQVRVQGSGFDPPVRVSFGGVFADVLSVQPNVVTVSTPSIDLAVGGTSTVPVTVSINVNDPEDPPGSDTLANAYTYARAGQTLAPSIISVSPTSGPNEGGTQVTIFGENFADAVQVFFGTSALIAAPVVSVSPTRVVVETPSATGPNSVNQNAIVTIRVVNVGSGAFADLSGAYQYGAPGGGIFISSAGPTEGYYFGGLNVTIFGQGFDEPVAVEFGDHAQQVISVTGTEIIARSVPVEIVDCDRPEGPFSVVNIETNEGSPAVLNFLYRPVEPLIGTIDPTEIPIVAATREILPSGATATLTGSGFDFGGEFLPIPPRVTFGEDATAPLVAGSEVLDTGFDPRYGIVSRFIVVIPRYLESFQDIDCNDALGNEGTRPRPARVDVTVLNVPTGCTDSVSFDYIPVQADGSQLPCVVGGSSPEARFSVSVDNLTASFMDVSTNDPTSWEWSFGDGASSFEQNPEHTYAVAGIYTVTLIAANDFGTDQTSDTVTVAGASPVAAFTFQGVAGSDTISFLDQSTGSPTSWLWEFGDGATSTAQNPTHDYGVATPTVFTVTLTVTNSGGSDSTGQLIEVPVPGPPVEAAFSFGGASGGLVVNFIDESNGDPTSWSWDFGDASVSAENAMQNPVHTYAVAGTYTVTLTAMNGSSTDTSPGQLVTVPLP